MGITNRNLAPTIEAPAPAQQRARMIPGRARQSIHQVRDRVWKAKIRKVERIEAEEDRMWGVIAERIANDPNEAAIPWDPVSGTFIEAPCE